jgi:cell surface protein SprA
MPGTTAMGMDQWSSPGFGYIAGWQPDDKYFDRVIAPDNNWITKNIFQNQLVILGQSQNIDAQVNLEPFNDLKVDLNAGRTYQNTHTELFKVKAAGEGFSRYTGRDIGSYTTTYFTLNTFFDDLDDVFDRFETNRTTISSRLGVTPDPNVPGYTTGFGKVQQDVLIPAFLSAYSNTDPNKQDLDVFNTFPKINWQLTYNGLTKIEFFKKFFSSVNVTHAYKSTLASIVLILSNYDDADPFKFNPITNNYYSRLEIPAVSITEGLSPLIRFDFKTKSDITFNIDYKKLRNLSLSFVDNMVNETKSADITIGAGYTLHNVKMPFMKEFQMKKNKKKKAQNSKDPGKTSSVLDLKAATKPPKTT